MSEEKYPNVDIVVTIPKPTPLFMICADCGKRHKIAEDWLDLKDKPAPVPTCCRSDGFYGTIEPIDYTNTRITPNQ